MAKKRDKKERLKAELRRGAITRNDIIQKKEAKLEKKKAKEERKQEKWNAKIANKLHVGTDGDAAAGTRPSSSSKRAQGILTA